MLEGDIPDIHVTKCIKRIFTNKNCIIWTRHAYFKIEEGQNMSLCWDIVYKVCIHDIIAKITRYADEQLQAGGYQESNKKINKILIYLS